jgi:GNAT superfamily N-acetyltransferase
MNVIAVGPADDPVLISHYLAIWDSYGTPKEDFVPGASDVVAHFIENSRAHSQHGGFLAVVDGEIAGSAMCCLLHSPYPDVIKPERRLRGYIWSVFTVPSYRGRGVGKAMTERAIAHLRNVGCTHIVLHASDSGAPLYERRVK